MFHIQKGKEPKKLALHRNDGGTYDDFSLDKGKREVKNQLLKEQSKLCAYCTTSINFDETINFDNMKVEHWLPQNNENHPEYKEFELQYSNMLGVCKGCTLYNGKKFYHCDDSGAKGDEVIEINPQNKVHIDLLSYNKSGFLKSSNPIHQNEIDTDLKLNIPPLQKERKKQLYNLKIGLYNNKKKKKTPNYARILKQFTAKNIPYSAIIIWYLKKKLNQANANISKL